MKLRMSVGKRPMSGYSNVDPAPQIEPDKRESFEVKPLDFRSLDIAAFDAECEEVFVDGAIDYIKDEILPQFIAYCVKKLRKNGIINLSGTDIKVANRMFYNGEISEEQLNLMLYGGGNHPWAFKNGCHSLPKVKKILENLGLKILTLKYDGVNLHVSARRS
jgi:hypothetical protein